LLISTNIIVFFVFSIIIILFYLFAFRMNWREVLDPFLIRFVQKIPSYVTPNHISIAGFLIFLVAGLFLYLVKYSPFFSFGFAVFIILYGISDSLDGILARTRNQISKSGIFLDQTSGKLGELFVLFAIILGGYVRAEFVVIIMLCRLFYSYINMQSLALTGGKFSRPESSRWFILTIAFALILFFIKFFGLEILNIFGRQIKSLDVLFLLISFYYLGITFYRAGLLWKKLIRLDQEEKHL